MHRVILFLGCCNGPISRMKRLEAPFWHAATAVCIQERSGLVPTVSVLWFGLPMCFGPFCAGCGGAGQTDGFIAIPHERDGLSAPSLFASTSACVPKRSGLVPTVSVISFGLLICFGLYCACCWLHGWTKLTALLQFLLNKIDRDLPSCLQVLRHVYRRGLDWFQQHWSYIDCFPPRGVQKWRQTKNARCFTFGTGSSRDQVQSLYSHKSPSVQ